MLGATEGSGGWLWLQNGAAGLRPDLRPLQRIHSLVWRQLNPSNPCDKWSHEILRFKQGNGEAMVSVTSLLLDRLPCLLSDLGFSPRQPMNLVTALPATAARPSPEHPLYKLASIVQRKMDGPLFLSKLLRKEPHYPLHGLHDAASRDAAVAGKYSVDAGTGVSEESRLPFLILDDFATRGATLADIARSITSVWPRNAVHAVTLAKNVYHDTLSQMGYTEDDNERRLGKNP